MKYDIKCKHCGRFLATAEKSVSITLKCSNSACKRLDVYNITFVSDMGGNHVYHTPKNKALA